MVLTIIISLIITIFFKLDKKIFLNIKNQDKLHLIQIIKNQDKLHLIQIMIIIIFFKPYYIEYAGLTNINFIYVNIFRILFVCSVFIFLSMEKKSIYLKSLLVFFIVRIASTLYLNGSFERAFSQFYTTFTACVFIEYWFKKNWKTTIKSFSFVFSFFMINSFLTILNNPHGYGAISEKQYFQKPGNQLSIILIVGIMFLLIDFYIEGKSKFSLFILSIYFMNTYSIICTKSTSGILAWTIFSIYYFLNNILVKLRIINFSSIIIGYILFFYSVVFLKIQNKFSYFIESILGKNITFTGRVQLWDSAMEMIRNKPLLGQGVLENTNIIYSARQKKYLSTHNQFIQITVESGFIGLILLGILFVVVGFNIKRINDRNITVLFSFALLSILMVLFSEAVGVFDLMLVLAIGNNLYKVER